MQPNYFFSSPHFPYNLPHPSPIPVNCSWSGDTSYSNTPVSVALYNTTATSSWAHTVPAFMPWVTESGASTSSTTCTNTEQIMRFTAPFPPDPCTSQTATSWELFNNLGASKTNANIHLKRRCELDETEISHKQYITEEKMAARLQQLHITNHYSPPPPSPTQGNYETNLQKPSTKVKPITTLRELEALLKVDTDESSQKASLVLAPEIKSLVEPEKLFAKTLLNQVERPTMAVVLWKPPHGSMEDVRTSSSEQTGYEVSIGDSENNFVPSSTLLAETNNNTSTSSDIIHQSSLGHGHAASTSSPILPDFPLPMVNKEDADYVMEV